MEIAENLQDWYTNFTEKWLAEYEQTGKIDWKLYSYIKNESAPESAGTNLAQSRLIFITSAGAYLDSGQQAFDASNDLGDYSIREIPFDTPFNKLKYAHEHYDHASVNEDPQALLPLLLLEEMRANGTIGELAPSFISFMGYQPDIKRVVEELIPPIIDMVKRAKAATALLVPS